MKKEYKVSGMSCGHCRAHVEEALNSIEGVKKATVTLTPGKAVIEFEGEEIPLSKLQETVTEEAGDYTLE